MEVEGTHLQECIPRIMVRQHRISAASEYCIKTMAFKNDTEGVIGLVDDAERETLMIFGPNNTSDKVPGIKGTIHDMIYFPLYKSYFAWCAEDNGIYQIQEDFSVRCIAKGLDNVNYLSKAFKIYGEYLFVNQERGFRVYSGLNNPEPTMKEIKLKHKNSVAFNFLVLSDDRILYLSPNSLLMICDWEGNNILEYKTPDQTGYCRGIAFYPDSNEFILNYTTRRSEQTSLDWFSIGEDKSSINLEGRITFNGAEEDWKFDGILLTRSSRNNKLMVVAWNMLIGKVQFFTREGDRVYECCNPAHYDIQYTFMYNEDTNRIWLANRVGPMREWIIR